MSLDDALLILYVVLALPLLAAVTRKGDESASTATLVTHVLAGAMTALVVVRIIIRIFFPEAMQ